MSINNQENQKGQTIQIKVQENNKAPGEPIFIREDGKIGFSTVNSIPLTIGDVVKGTVMLDEPHFFTVLVTEVISSGD